jgi:hypothetical protein
MLDRQQLLPVARSGIVHTIFEGRRSLALAEKLHFSFVEIN